MGFLLLVSNSYLVYGFLCMDFGLQVKVEVLILLGEVRSMAYMSLLLYSNKL